MQDGFTLCSLFSGVQLSSPEIAKLLTKMSLPSTVSIQDEKKIVVEIGPTRHDILHACDIIGNLKPVVR